MPEEHPGWCFEKKVATGRAGSKGAVPGSSHALPQGQPAKKKASDREQYLGAPRACHGLRSLQLYVNDDMMSRRVTINIAAAPVRIIHRVKCRTLATY